MKTPIIVPSSSRSGGFTLIELLVVLTVIGLLAAAATHGIGLRPAGLERGEVAARVREAVADAIQRSRRNGSIARVEAPLLAPELAFVPTIAGRSRGSDVLLVYPDGSTSGGVFSLAGDDLVIVDWLTGEVRNAS